ncbi:MAG: hypothetical protein HY283_00065 [Nitrospirae bacterium]|nr:hypothetical protein [Nitrospirota bacterium]
MKTVPLILLVLLFFAFDESGKSIAAATDFGKASDRPIYRYAGPNGTPVFTDDPSRIPAEYRSSTQVVELPPLIKMPEPPPPPKPDPLSFATRLREWIQSQPPEYRLIIIGVLPVLILSLGVLSFLRKRVESAFLKTSLRLGMLAIVVLSAYLCYFIFMRAQAAKLMGSIPGGNEIISSPKQKAEDLKKGEAGRLKTIENIANQK